MVKNGIYRHYKGKNYEVLGIVKHSETEEELVLYKQLYGDYELWVRPLEMFIETLENGQNRFEFLGDSNV